MATVKLNGTLKKFTSTLKDEAIVGQVVNEFPIKSIHVEDLVGMQDQQVTVSIVERQAKLEFGKPAHDGKTDKKSAPAAK